MQANRLKWFLWSFLLIASLPLLVPPGVAGELPTPKKSGFPIEFCTNKTAQKNHLQFGEKLKVSVKSGRDAWLTLVSLNAKGEAVVLFPNAFDTDNRLASGMEKIVPAENASYSFTMAATESQDVLVAIIRSTAAPLLAADKLAKVGHLHLVPNAADFWDSLNLLSQSASEAFSIDSLVVQTVGPGSILGRPEILERTTPDGAWIGIAPGASSSAQLSIRQVEPISYAIASGAKKDDPIPASPVFEVKVTSEQPEFILIALPITMKPPASGAAGLFTPEQRDPGSENWRQASRLYKHDKEKNQILFNISPEPEVSKQFRLTYSVFGSEHTYSSRRFVIHFYENGYGPKHGVVTDAEWLTRLNGNPTGNAVRAGIPDFIEDMSVACEKVLTALLSMRNSGGAAVFKEPSLPMHVYVRNTGEGSGESPIGGPMYVSNSNINRSQDELMSGWEDMTHVVAHEMTHVLQAQYYVSGFTGNTWNLLGPANVWFIEATANYFSLRACLPAPVIRREFYCNDPQPNYLSVSLTANDSLSYYMASHFLEWLSDRYGEGFVGDVLARRGSLDNANLEAELQRCGETQGIRGAFAKYLAWLMPRPEVGSGLNKKIKDALAAKTAEIMYKQCGISEFNQRLAWMSFEKEMPPLSAALIPVPMTNFIPANSLLVVDPSESSFTAGDVVFLSRDVCRNTDAPYQNRRPLEETMLGVGARPYIIPDFWLKGRNNLGFEQLIFNGQLKGCPRVKVYYYLLQPPMVSVPTLGAITWSTVEVWNIPPRFIKGYNVYAEGRKLNSDPVPYAVGEQSFSHNSIKPGTAVAVSVVDRLGNVWPEYAGISPRTVRLRKGEKMLFKATFSEPVEGAPVVADWRMIEASAGKISQNGQYTAPDRPGNFLVEVVNRNNPTQKARAEIEISDVTLTLTATPVKGNPCVQLLRAEATNVATETRQLSWRWKLGNGQTPTDVSTNDGKPRLAIERQVTYPSVQNRRLEVRLFDVTGTSSAELAVATLVLEAPVISSAAVEIDGPAPTPAVPPAISPEPAPTPPPLVESTFRRSLADLHTLKNLYVEVSGPMNYKLTTTSETNHSALIRGSMDITWSGASFSGKRQVKNEITDALTEISGTVSADGNTLLTLTWSFSQVITIYHTARDNKCSRTNKIIQLKNVPFLPGREQIVRAEVFGADAHACIVKLVASEIDTVQNVLKYEKTYVSHDWSGIAISRDFEWNNYKLSVTLR